MINKKYEVFYKFLSEILLEDKQLWRCVSINIFDQRDHFRQFILHVNLTPTANLNSTDFKVQTRLKFKLNFYMSFLLLILNIVLIKNLHVLRVIYFNN